MFKATSLRPETAADEAIIRAEMEMARKGGASRVVFAVILAAVSLIWLHPLASFAYAVAAFCYERFARPWLTELSVKVCGLSRPRLRAYYRVTIFLAACLYTIIPATGLISLQMAGWYVTMMAFCSAVISGITYFSNDRWQFMACIGPSFLMACLAPYLFHASLAGTIAVLVLNVVFVMAALRSAAHRGELVESITRESAARDQAEIASVQKSSFIANVSHELRTPLNAIIGYTELLTEAADEDGRASDARDLNKVSGAAKHLLNLIGELLDISKIEAGKLTLTIEEFDVRGMLDNAIATVKPMVNANGNRVSIECPRDIGCAASDEFRLNQCILNLMSNAAKFTRDGEITIRASREQVNGADWLTISVADTGIGMTPEQMVHLFEPFTQADATTTRQFGGTGLGLTITRRLARMLGGEVTAASHAGRGSVFTLRVPAIAPQASATTEAVAA